jgi:hypothetical protein
VHVTLQFAFTVHYEPTLFLMMSVKS